MGSSRTRYGTCISCIGGQILYHWATRETNPKDRILCVADVVMPSLHPWSSHFQWLPMASSCPWRPPYLADGRWEVSGGKCFLEQPSTKTLNLVYTAPSPLRWDDSEMLVLVIAQWPLLGLSSHLVPAVFSPLIHLFAPLLAFTRIISNINCCCC